MKEKTCFKGVHIFSEYCNNFYWFIRFSEIDFDSSKTSITKSRPRKFTYRDYESFFVFVTFNEVLKYDMAKEKLASCTDEIFLQILNKHSTLERKVLRKNVQQIFPNLGEKQS